MHSLYGHQENDAGRDKEGRKKGRLNGERGETITRSYVVFQDEKRNGDYRKWHDRIYMRRISLGVA